MVGVTPSQATLNNIPEFARGRSRTWSNHQVTESAQFVPAQDVVGSRWPRPPRVVSAAVVITLVSAIGTVLVTIPFVVIGLWVAGPIVDSFDPGSGDNARWFVAGAGIGIVALSVTAGTLAIYVLRRRIWASWLLIALSSVSAILGGILGYYILPLAVTAVAVTVTVLLLMPSARAWFRAAGNGQAGSQIPS